MRIIQQKKRITINLLPPCDTCDNIATMRMYKFYIINTFDIHMFIEIKIIGHIYSNIL